MKSQNNFKKLSITLLLLAMLVLAPASMAAEIWTDQFDYPPDQIVVISGSGFLADSDITVSVQWPDGWLVVFNAAADGSGEFTCIYEKEKYEGTYPVTATDGINTATTTFTDATPKFTYTTSGSLRTNYNFGTKSNSVFDFGVASRGPLSLAGNIQLEGVNVSVEASAYIESLNSNLALSIIGNSQIAGDVSIVNSTANVLLQGGQAGIGGETGNAAINNHVHFGVPPTSFPTPNPNHFRHYTTNIIDPTTNTSADATFENVRIVAGTNPTFSGHVTLKGITFIETPNVVTFTGTTDVIGLIVGDGDLNDNSGTNQVIFQGGVYSQPVTNLPNEEKFAGIRTQTGTFLMAPGFGLSFGGNFHTLNGVIAGNGFKFFGNAGGTVNGSIINYSDETMTLTGNSNLYFNRSGTDHVPAGFEPEIAKDSGTL